MTNQSPQNFTDYYALLGIAPGSEIPEIRRAFLLLAKEHHPDAGGSTAVMLQLNAAYKTLMNPSSKASYDMLHGFHTGTKTGEYRYHGGKQVHDITDMDDDDIDAFLDELFAEYRNGPPKETASLKQKFAKFFKP